MQNIQTHYINGSWVPSIQAASEHSVINPATEESVATLTFGSHADVDLAIEAAHRAFPEFDATPLASRIDLIKRIATVYERRQDELALAVSTEMGAPLENVAKKLQVPMGLKHFQTAAELAPDFEWERQQGSTLLLREPIGVCALITPWNWPLNQIACKVAPALLSGCTVVLKPSEFAPLSALLFTEILHEAGVPAGVFNMVWGAGSEIGSRMASHPLVDMVSLTGSTAAGASVARYGADTIKRISLELGGKSANIILDDAPLEKAVTGGVMRMMNNSGQSCNAPSRMLVPAHKLAEAEGYAAAATERLLVGDPNDPSTQLGPIANKRQFSRVQGLIEKALEEGARLVAGGAGRPEHLNRGYFGRPTVLTALKPTLSIAREEIFGPVLTLIPYRDEAEAIRIANDTEYGLSGYVYGGTLEHARAVARQLRTGQVHLNGAPADLNAPFGGYKQSGLGREWGVSGIEEFTELKALLGAA